MNDLVDNMGKTGFFTQQTDPLTVAEGQAFWQVELNLGRRKRQLICGAPVTSILSRLTTLLSDLGQVQEWQRYWDQRSWPDRSKWLAFHSAWWASPERTLTDRNRKLKSMIITSFGSLPPRRRLAAAQRLAALVDEDPQLTKTQAEILVALLKALGGFGPTEGRLAWALSKSGQPSVVTPLVKHLIRQSAKESQSTLETMFSYMGKNVALAFLGNRESRLRAAACAGMWRYGGEEIDLALVKALGDKSMLVRRGAVYSLGKRGKKLSVPTLDDLLSKSADESLQRSIYTALGRIGGGAATQILLAKLKSAEDRMRPTLIAALGETRDRQVIEPLLSIYLKPKQDLLREVAAASLLALPRDAVQKRLVGLALDADADIKDRQSAVALLSRKWSRRVGTGLAALLNDGSAQLKQQAALVLAYYREKRAVPILLDALSRSPDSAEIRHALEAVTMTRFGVAAEEVVGKYRGWWAAQGKQSWRQWLLDALERDGFEVGGLRTYVKEGKLPAGGVEPLITALTDPRWYLAHGASLALNEIFDLPRPPLARLATGRKRQSTAKLWREVRLRHQEK